MNVYFENFHEKSEDLTKFQCTLGHLRIPCANGSYENHVDPHRVVAIGLASRHVTEVLPGSQPQLEVMGGGPLVLPLPMADPL